MIPGERSFLTKILLPMAGVLFVLAFPIVYLLKEDTLPPISLLVAMPMSLLLLFVFERHPSLGVFFVLLAVPLGGFELPVLDRTPKVYITSLVCGVWILAVLPKMLMPNNPFKDLLRRKNHESRMVVRLVLAYCALSLVSLFQMIDYQRSIYILFHRLLALAVFLLALTFGKQAKHRVRILECLVIVGGAVAILYFFGNVQAYDTSSMESLATDIARKDNLASAGLLGVSNTIASFMTFTIPMTVALTYMRGASPKQRLFGFISLALQIATMIITNSRGGTVALLVSIVTASLFVPSTWTRLSSVFKWLVGFLIFAVTGFVLLLMTPDSITARYQSVFSPDALTANLLARFELLNVSWQAFINRPIFGTGIGNIGFYDLHFGTGAGSETHNMFLETLAEEGFFSFVVLISLLVILGYRLAVLARKDAGPSQLWVLAAFIGCMLNAMVEPTFWAPQFVNLFWISIAVLTSGPLLQANPREVVHAEATAAVKLIPNPGKI